MSLSSNKRRPLSRDLPLGLWRRHPMLVKLRSSNRTPKQRNEGSLSHLSDTQCLALSLFMVLLNNPLPLHNIRRPKATGCNKVKCFDMVDMRRRHLVALQGILPQHNDPPIQLRLCCKYPRIISTACFARSIPTILETSIVLSKAPRLAAIVVLSLIVQAVTRHLSPQRHRVQCPFVQDPLNRAVEQVPLFATLACPTTVPDVATRIAKPKI